MDAPGSPAPEARTGRVARHAQGVGADRAHRFGRKPLQPFGKSRQRRQPTGEGGGIEPFVGSESSSKAHRDFEVIDGVEQIPVHAGDFKAKAVRAEIDGSQMRTNLDPRAMKEGIVTPMRWKRMRERDMIQVKSNPPASIPERRMPAFLQRPPKTFPRNTSSTVTCRYCSSNAACFQCRRASGTAARASAFSVHRLEQPRRILRDPCRRLEGAASPGVTPRHRRHPARRAARADQRRGPWHRGAAIRLAQPGNPARTRPGRHRLPAPCGVERGERRWIEEYFRSQWVQPLLTPIGLDPAHPSPGCSTRA